MTDATPLSRRIPRREVLAFIALTGDEASMPHQIAFREYHHSGRNWHVVDLEVDSEAAVRFWAGVFGHGEANLYQDDGGGVADGRRRTVYRSQANGWRGFTTAVRALVVEPADIPLDDATRVRLAEIADPTDPEVSSS